MTGGGNRKQNVKLHKERLKKANRKVRDTGKPYYNGVGEAEVVQASYIKDEIHDFTLKHLKNHPTAVHGYEHLESVKTSWGTDGFVGPYQALAELTGVHVRRISAIAKGQADIPHISLTQAEKILREIGTEYKLANGEIPVVPNPNWSMEKWMTYMEERGCV